MRDVQKPIIVILGNEILLDENKPSSNYYKVNELYVRRVKEAGGIPVGIIDLNDTILDKCDGFIIQGGNKIMLAHYKMIEYALRNDNPLLGICAGMQAICLYDVLTKICEDEKLSLDSESLYQRYKEMTKNGERILSMVQGHTTKKVATV